MKYNYITFFIRAPDAPPLDVKFVALGKKSFSWSWKTPSQDSWNGKLTGYEVCLFKQESTSKPRCKTTSVMLSHTINNLEPATKYFVTVSAATSVGFGPRSPRISKITNEGT